MVAPYSAPLYEAPSFLPKSNISISYCTIPEFAQEASVFGGGVGWAQLSEAAKRSKRTQGRTDLLASPIIGGGGGGGSERRQTRMAGGAGGERYVTCLAIVGPFLAALVPSNQGCLCHKRGHSRSALVNIKSDEGMRPLSVSTTNVM